MFGMNGIRIAGRSPSGPSAASMNGLRRPIGVWNESLHGPITSGSAQREEALGAEHERRSACPSR